MSAISLLRSDCALVVISLIPRLAASSLMDCVSVIRNGFASFSDWANPTVTFLRSSLGTPPLYLSYVQPPAPAVFWTCCWAALLVVEGASFAPLVQALATSTSVARELTAIAFLAKPRGPDIGGLRSLSGRRGGVDSAMECK